MTLQPIQSSTQCNAAGKRSYMPIAVNSVTILVPQRAMRPLEMIHLG